MEDRSSRSTRRRFLSKALVAAALWKASARPAVARPNDPQRERLVRLLARYGSELGDLRRVEGGE
jgi:hypothetical protein